MVAYDNIYCYNVQCSLRIKICGFQGFEVTKILISICVVFLISLSTKYFHKMIHLTCRDICQKHLYGITNTIQVIAAVCHKSVK